MIFLDNLINGLSLGSIYAIIALGYTMVYGIARMLNFAHGDVIMVGAYIAFCGLQYWGLPQPSSWIWAGTWISFQPRQSKSGCSKPGMTCICQTARLN